MELQKYRQKVTEPWTVCSSAKSVLKLLRLTVLFEISRQGGRNVYCMSTSESLNAEHASQMKGTIMTAAVMERMAKRAKPIARLGVKIKSATKVARAMTITHRTEFIAKVNP